jgi:DNA adenine methylase
MGKYVRNPLTGRYILVGGKTYLKVEGHVSKKPKSFSLHSRSCSRIHSLSRRPRIHSRSRRSSIHSRNCSHSKSRDTKVSPLIWWTGGKIRLINELLKLMPDKFNNYYEPFFGSGVVFLNVINTFHPKKVVINDINVSLCSLYKILKSPSLITEFKTECKKLEKKYNNIKSVDQRKNFFIRIRNIFNKEKKNSPKCVAYFYFLLRTMFNGIYTRNRKGELISGFGKGEDIELMSEEKLKRMKIIHHLLTSGRMEIHNKYFTDVLKKATKGDFVYLDPPYVPTDTKLFDSNKDVYQVSGSKATSGYGLQFNDEDHENVMKTFLDLDRRGVKVMMSNAYNTKLIKFFKQKGYNVYPMKVNRLISRNASTRYTNRFNEVVITNYK